jgi:sulfate-transporting ATPase
LIAVRSNERAAAALGVNRHGAKLYAFALSAAIAALGGVLMAYRFSNVLYAGSYTVLHSINAVLVGVIGGIGWVSGALLSAAVFIPDGLAARPLANYSGLTETLRTLAGFIVLATLIFNQNGMAETHNFAAIVRRFRKGKTQSPQAPPAPRIDDEAVVRPASLEIRDLTVRFSGVVAVDGVSLSVNPGEVVGLIGPNGAGKTTLIDGVTGFVPLAGGEVRLDGRGIGGWSVAKRARAGLGRSFQSLELFDDMTVLDNLRTASDRHDVRSYLLDLIRPADVPLSKGAWSAITELGLAEDLNARTEDLSYGRRRLVAIARTLATGPAVLLLDEPCAGLDDEESRHLGDLICRLARQWGIGVLLVEHNVDLVMKVCDRITVLDSGRVIAEGTPSVVQAHEAVVAAYLGEEDDTADDTADDVRGRQMVSAVPSGAAGERRAQP